MVQALNIGFQRPVLTLFTDGISKNLAKNLLGSADNEALIVEEAGNAIQPGSALDLLANIGAIEYDGDLLRALRARFPEVAK